MKVVAGNSHGRRGGDLLLAKRLKEGRLGVVEVLSTRASVVSSTASVSSTTAFTNSYHHFLYVAELE